jgi:hypothetical protein
MIRLRKKVVGQVAKVSLPQFDINNLPAKVDTGAFRCRLHCDDVSKGSDGRIHFTIGGQEFVEDSYKPKMRIRTKSITGHEKREYAIKSDIIIKGKPYRTDFVLSDRRDKNHQILLGRKLLIDGGFIVDVRRDIESDIEYIMEVGV